MRIDHTKLSPLCNIANIFHICSSIISTIQNLPKSKKKIEIHVTYEISTYSQSIFIIKFPKCQHAHPMFPWLFNQNFHFLSYMPQQYNVPESFLYTPEIYHQLHKYHLNFTFFQIFPKSRVLSKMGFFYLFSKHYK